MPNQLHSRPALELEGNAGVYLALQARGPGRWRGIGRWASVGMALAVLVTLCRPAQSEPSTPATAAPADPLSRSAENVQTFNAAWEIINDTYFDPTFHGLDWNGVRAELEPKARAASTTPELRAIIEDMLSRLGDSHMAVIPANIAPAPPFSPDEDPNDPPGDGQVGMDLRILEGRVVVWNVDAEGSAAKAGVRAGWIVAGIGKRTAAELLQPLESKATTPHARFLAWRSVTAALSGRVGSTSTVHFLDGADKPVTLSLVRLRPRGEPAKLGFLPTFYARLEGKPLAIPGGGRAGLIEFNVWMVPIIRSLDEKIDEFRQADGIIFDLRGNLGGLGGMILGVSGHFLNERVSLGTLKMRGSDLSFFTNPRRVNAAGARVTPYAGPLAILTDHLSLSAAEIFAGGMQALGRARVFGETTGGQALPAIWDRLPNGDLLYHVFGDFVTASGVRLEGRGVSPDETIAVTRQDLLAGRDPTLLAALRWISAQKASRGAEATSRP